MALIAKFDFDGADGATTTSDSSGVGTKTFTFVGNASIRTDQSKYGGSSLYSNTAGYLRVQSTEEMNLTGDFSLQFWVRFTTSKSMGIVSGLTGTSPYLYASSLESGPYWWYPSNLGTTTFAVLSDEFIPFGVCRSGYELRMFCLGYRYHKTTSSVAWNFRDLYLGLFRPNNDQYSISYYDRFEVYDTCLWEYGYDPETLAPTLGPPTSSALPHPAQTAPILPVGELGYSALDTLRSTVDGHGVIVGTVKIDPDMPASRKVRLYDQRSGKCIRETWSDAAGNYAFTDLQVGRKFTVLAYDYQHVFRAIAVDQVNAT